MINCESSDIYVTYLNQGDDTMARRSSDKGTSNTKPDNKKPKNRGRSFRKKMLIFYLIAAIAIAGSYPIGSYAFDKILASDITVSVLPDGLLQYIPMDFFENLVNRVKGTQTSADTASTETSASDNEGATLDTGSLDTTTAASPNILSETTAVSDTYYTNTLFLGDSISTALKEYELVPAANVFALDGVTPRAYLTTSFTDSSTGINGAIDKIAATRKPDRFYIELGVNGIGSADDDYYQAFRDLIDTLKEQSPESAIVLETIYPVSASPKSSETGITNANIDAANAKLLEIANEKDVYYLNIASDLKDASGVMNPSYDSGDGIHYNKSGYTAIMNYIKTHAVPSK